MSTIHSFANNVRKSLRKITDEETRCDALRYRQDVEEVSEIPFHATLETIPFRRWGLAAGPRQVEPVFDVDGKDAVTHDVYQASISSEPPSRFALPHTLVPF
mgnify:CR=1 FL=1